MPHLLAAEAIQVEAEAPRGFAGKPMSVDLRQAVDRKRQGRAAEFA